MASNTSKVQLRALVGLLLTHQALNILSFSGLLTNSLQARPTIKAKVIEALAVESAEVSAKNTGWHSLKAYFQCLNTGTISTRQSDMAIKR